MTFESVPWMVGGGALHSAEVGRLLAYASFRGNEGIVGLGDLKVSALATPGASVQISAGACAVTNKSGAYQSYAARNLLADTALVAGTGATGRSDMVVVRVEDPYIAGNPWAAPAVGSEGDGPYVFIRVISGVPATAKSVADVPALAGQSAIALARIDIPANTSAITSTMITDLRVVANPRSDSRLYTFNPAAVVGLTSATLIDWVGSWQVDVPLWATKAAVSFRVDGAGVDRASTSTNGFAIGYVLAALGSLATTQATNYDIDVSTSAKASRFTVGGADTITLPAAYRGSTQTLKLRGLRSSGNKNLYADTNSSCQVSILFTETAA